MCIHVTTWIVHLSDRFQMLNSLADVKYYTEITYFPEIVSASNKHLIFEVQIAPSKM